MKTAILILGATSLFGCVSYHPTTETSFANTAFGGCKDEEEMIVRGQVSSATENTLVLSDSSDTRSTMSVKLPGRGTAARLRGMIGTSKYEESRSVLNRLGAASTPVVLTLLCQGHSAPIARNITYNNADGSRSSISF